MKLNPEALPDLYAVVLSLEWESYEDEFGATLRICPVCGRYPSEGHLSDCALYLAILKAES